ncbi:MAG: sensor histidine kinase [Thermoguttaceae bacterium]
MSTAPSTSRRSEEDTRSIRVLVVHPLRVERVRLIRPLRTQFGRSVEVCEASGAEEALNLLSDSPFDVVLAGQTMHGERGLDLAAQLAEIAPETATVLIADEDTPELAAEVARSAACDYVIRGEVDGQQLARAISGAIRQVDLQREYRRMVRQMSQSYDQLDHLVRALSHDMNANFMLMESSFSRLERTLEEKQPGDVDLKEVAAHVGACMTESRRFLNDLVALARTGRVEMEPELADTNAVAEEVLFEQREVLAEAAVAVELCGPLPKLWCNRHRLKQVITNLVRNAVKHGTDPSRPRIRIWGESAGEGSGMAIVRIHDNGAGIPPHWREEVFLPGRRMPGTEADGSGMGLAIVRKIVQHYGGSVRVAPGEVEGTTLEIELPSVAGPQEAWGPPAGSATTEPLPADRRLDHDRPHEDPALHPHCSRSHRSQHNRRFSGSDS